MPSPQVPESSNPIDERTQLVLQGIIDSYIETTEPVGSRTLSRRLELPLSPATVRNARADLEQRGLLDETLVVAVGEIGRTPKPDTKAWGRGHWSHCFPCVLAGAGVRGGITYGTSDSHSAYPKHHTVRPEELAKTIYWSLGINPDLMLPDAEGRPVPIIESGKPLTQLFG